MKKLISFHYTALFTGSEEDITVYLCNGFFHIHHYKSAMNQGTTNVFEGEEWYDRFMISYEASMESLQMAVETYLDKVDDDVYHLIYKEA